MTARDSWSHRAANAALALKLRAVLAVHGARLARLSKDPMRAQRALLAGIIAANKDTTFGRRHGFGGIGNYEQFAERVPVSTFEDLRPFVDAEIERGETALTAEKPLCYVRTSGTTGKPKDLPLTASHLEALRRIQEIAIAFQHRACPAAFRGPMLGIVSPAIEGQLANGRTFGSASGVVQGSSPRAVRNKFVLPAAVLAIKEAELKYLLVMRLAVARADLTYLATANPTTVLHLMRVFRQHAKELIDDIRNGGFFLVSRLSPEVAVAVTSRLVADPRRADELERMTGSSSEVRVADRGRNWRTSGPGPSVARASPSTRSVASCRRARESSTSVTWPANFAGRSRWGGVPAAAFRRSTRTSSSSSSASDGTAGTPLNSSRWTGCARESTTTS
jgi:hypothetical protein